RLRAGRGNLAFLAKFQQFSLARCLLLSRYPSNVFFLRKPVMDADFPFSCWTLGWIVVPEQHRLQCGPPEFIRPAQHASVRHLSALVDIDFEHNHSLHAPFHGAPWIIDARPVQQTILTALHRNGLNSSLLRSRFERKK